MERPQQDVLPTIQADVETLRQELEKLSTCVAARPQDDSHEAQIETRMVIKGR